MGGGTVGIGYNPCMNSQVNQVVYAVVESAGEGPLVQGVFSTKALAEAFLAGYRTAWNSDDIYIHEWVIDEKAGWRRTTIHRAAVSIAGAIREPLYCLGEVLPPGEKSGCEIGWIHRDKVCIGWSTVSLEHAEELAVAGRKDYFHVSG